MSEDDLLRRAARALRHESAESAVPGAASGSGEERLGEIAGLAGVLRDVRRAARRRRLTVVAAFQVAAALIGLGAWAAVSGRLPRFLGGAPPEIAPEARARPRVAGTRPIRPATQTSPPPAPLLEPAAAPAVEPRAAPAPDVANARRPVFRPLAPAAPQPQPTPAPLPPAPRSDEDALYREAHTAHFVRRDPQAALAAWDRYLASSSPRLALEARYNRAISLIRLGRREEAAAALRPFAAGEHAGYRAEEARKLLQRLNERP